MKLNSPVIVSYTFSNRSYKSFMTAERMFLYDPPVSCRRKEMMKV